jgi:hypothetical protein
MRTVIVLLSADAVRTITCPGSSPGALFERTKFMSTTIKNIDTNEIITITMCDPRTGCDWSSDFIGNANDGTGRIGDLIHCDDDDVDWQGDNYTVNWWKEYSEIYGLADNRAYAAIQAAEDINGEDEARLYDNFIGGLEFIDLADGLNELADTVEDFNKLHFSEIDEQDYPAGDVHIELIKSRGYEILSTQVTADFDCNELGGKITAEYYGEVITVYTIGELFFWDVSELVEHIAI